MHRLRLLVATVACVVAAALLTASPSHADSGDETVTVPHLAIGSLSVGCMRWTATARGLDPATYYTWSVRDAAGRETDFGALYEVGTTTFTFHACPLIHRAGRWSVLLAGTDGVEHRVATFTVSYPRLVLDRVSRRAVRARLTLDGRPLANRDVGTEELFWGSWTGPSYLRTNTNGAVVVRCEKKRRHCRGQRRFDYEGWVLSQSYVLTRRTAARTSPATAALRAGLAA